MTSTNPLGQQTTFAHNSQEQVTAVNDSLGNSIQFGYSAGDLVSTTDSFGRTTTRVTDNLGRLQKITDPVGNSTQLTYNTLNQVTSTMDGLSNITSFSFDHSGNLLTVMDANQHTTTYTYDNMDRLSTRKDPLQNQESYQYDGNGNVTQFSDRRNKTATFSYDGLNRTTLAGYGTTAGPAYESSVNYTYDSGNRLTQLADTSSGTITRGYDNLDRLTSDATPQGTVGYGYETACRRTSLTVQFVVLADALGSTVGLADVTGILKTNYTHEPFGNTTATSTSNSTAYTGRELDATDLYFYRARYYNPTLQRFVSEGPLGFGGGDFNLNVYVGNTPTNYRDPSGEHRFICIPCLPNPGFGGRKSFPSDAYVPPWIPIRRFGPASKGLPGRYPPNSGPRDPESPINPIVEPPTSRVKYRGIK